MNFGMKLFDNDPSVPFIEIYNKDDSLTLVSVDYDGLYLWHLTLRADNHQYSLSDQGRIRVIGVDLI